MDRLLVSGLCDAVYTRCRPGWAHKTRILTYPVAKLQSPAKKSVHPSRWCTWRGCAVSDTRSTTRGAELGLVVVRCFFFQRSHPRAQQVLFRRMRMLCTPLRLGVVALLAFSQHTCKFHRRRHDLCRRSIVRLFLSPHHRRKFEALRTILTNTPAGLSSLTSAASTYPASP